MYPPALKGLFHFLCMRPHTHECNYVRQKFFPSVAILLVLDGESVDAFHTTPSAKKNNRRKRDETVKMNRKGGEKKNHLAVKTELSLKTERSKNTRLSHKRDGRKNKTK